jgi:hypothetical protein
MPEVRVEVTVDIDEYVDVDIEDILDDCSESEIQAAIKWLKDNDYLVNEQIINDSIMSLSEENFQKNVQKFSELYFAMSIEDSAVIETILNKY